ncbi:unnamed protein product [Durusdinium trenchii]|uniref:Uncharacterized protein n=1 Tax=Durusdinium trenchii TaxID=1381693 RepID=A0ABP0PKI5_9DINO
MKRLFVAVATLWSTTNGIHQARKNRQSVRAGGLDIDEELREVAQKAEETVQAVEAEAEKPTGTIRRRGPFWATFSGLLREKASMPYSQFENKCVEHLQEVSTSLADAYGEAQVKHLLRSECRLEGEFPQSVNSGFNEVEECMKFADKLAAVQKDQGFSALCKQFYQQAAMSSQQRVSQSDSKAGTAGDTHQANETLWWSNLWNLWRGFADKMYRAPDVGAQVGVSRQDSKRFGQHSDAGGSAVSGSRDAETTEDSLTNPRSETSSAKSVAESTDDAANAAYEESLQAGKNPDEAAEAAAAAAGKAAARAAKAEGKSPEEIERVAAEAARKAALANGLSDEEAAAAGASAQRTAGSAASLKTSSSGSRGSASIDSHGSTTSSDSKGSGALGRAGAESPDRTGHSGLTSWFNWLWSWAWPVRSDQMDKSYSGAPAKSTSTSRKEDSLGLQEADLDRLDAILDGARDGGNISGSAAEEQYISVCTKHLKKVGRTIDSSYSDIEAEQVLKSQCMLDKEFASSRQESFMKEKECNLFAKLFLKARYQDLVGSAASYKKLCKWYFTYIQRPGT